eukprot:GEMP01059816.1.p1 GENE.GEMP01059816.1~~GEMP01059816.1.p1  ORF type:complete len:193 (+),score=27.38 GEMP01059816.1:688-1266(+)
MRHLLECQFTVRARPPRARARQVTIILLIFGVQFGFEYGGLFTLFPMDTMDLILYGSKIVHLRTCTVDGKPRSAKHQHRQQMTMAAILISWIITRLYLYNVVIYAAHTVFMGQNLDNVFTNHPYFQRTDSDGSKYVVYPVLCSAVYILLLALGLLQAAWSVMIGKVLFNLVRFGHVKDTVFNTHESALKKND